MTTSETAERLVALCRQGDFETAQKELFADDAVSIEPYASPEFAQETKGKAAIHEKGCKFQASVEKVHALEVSAPLLATNAFACTMRMDITMRGKGRMDMRELCVYELRDGKIISEQFYI